ncbi:MAG: FxsA family protein [Pseudomonadota bacterium]
MWLFFAFLTIPLVEIGLFITVGQAIGLWPTLLIVILTAVAGTYLLRSQGLGVMRDLQTRLNQLSDPSEPLIHGAMILFAGALLLTPGFFTDAVGLALMVPGARTMVAAQLRSRMTVVTPQRHDDGIIDGEFHEVDPPANARPSGWTRD